MITCYNLQNYHSITHSKDSMMVASDPESSKVLALIWLRTLPSCGRITIDSTGKLNTKEKISLKHAINIYFDFEACNQYQHTIHLTTSIFYSMHIIPRPIAIQGHLCPVSLRLRE